MGYVCEVLICVNYTSCCRLTNFNPAVTLALSLRFSWLHVSQFRTCDCDFFIPCRCSNASKEWTCTFLLHYLTQKAKWSWWFCTSRWHCSTSCPNILVDMASSDQRVYSNNDSTSHSTSHLIASNNNFTRSHNFVIHRIASQI